MNRIYRIPFFLPVLRSSQLLGSSQRRTARRTISARSQNGARLCATHQPQHLICERRTQFPWGERFREPARQEPRPTPANRCDWSYRHSRAPKVPLRPAHSGRWRAVWKRHSHVAKRLDRDDASMAFPISARHPHCGKVTGATFTANFPRRHQGGSNAGNPRRSPGVGWRGRFSRSQENSTGSENPGIAAA